MPRPPLDYQSPEPPEPPPPPPPPRNVLGCALFLAFSLCMLAATLGVLLQISGSSDRLLGKWIGLSGGIGALILPIVIVLQDR